MLICTSIRGVKPPDSLYMMCATTTIQSMRRYTMSWDLLSPLLGDVHNIETMKTLDITSLDHLSSLLESIHDVEALMIRLDHLSNINNQFLDCPCTWARIRPRAWLSFTCISLFVLRLACYVIIFLWLVLLIHDTWHYDIVIKLLLLDIRIILRCDVYWCTIWWFDMSFITLIWFVVSFGEI